MTLKVTLKEYLDECSIPEPNSGCLLWMRGTEKSGYGIAKWKGKNQKAHRLSWTEANGPIPPGGFICHKCDVRACIEPSHLWLGGPAENMADRDAKGRQSKGRAHSSAIKAGIRAAVLAAALSTGACGTSYTAVAPRAPAGLLLACQDPVLVPDPNNASVSEINIERIRVAQAYADCRQRHGDLAVWVQGR